MPHSGLIDFIPACINTHTLGIMSTTGNCNHKECMVPHCHETVAGWKASGKTRNIMQNISPS